MKSGLVVNIRRKSDHHHYGVYSRAKCFGHPLKAGNRVSSKNDAGFFRLQTETAHVQL